MGQLYIPVLLGGVSSQPEARFVAELIAAVGAGLDGIETEVISSESFDFPGDGNDPEGKDARYTAITARADGFFVVAAERNHGFPGSLKRMLDSELKHYIHKPVAFAGLSNDQWGGVRGIEALVSTVREMGLVVTFSDMQFPHAAELFDATGVLQNDSYRRYIEGAWTELIWMATVLRQGRETVPSKYHT